MQDNITKANDLNKVIDKLVKNFKPCSIFLYGSNATNSTNVNSDYEIGVIFDDDKYISRGQISNLVKSKTKYSIYPFRLSEIMNCDFDTPFQKTIYTNVLIDGGAKHCMESQSYKK